VSKGKVFRIADKPFPGPDYVCSKCDDGGVRLWRQSHMMLSHIRLLCAECAYKDQEKEVKQYDFQHHPQSSSIGNLIPARPTPEGDTFWGHTSGDVEWWMALKQYNDREKEAKIVRVERDFYFKLYQYELSQYLERMKNGR
jgi:hypothetical protein